MRKCIYEIHPNNQDAKFLKSRREILPVSGHIRGAPFVRALIIL